MGPICRPFQIRAKRLCIFAGANDRLLRGIVRARPIRRPADKIKLREKRARRSFPSDLRRWRSRTDDFPGFSTTRRPFLFFKTSNTYVGGTYAAGVPFDKSNDRRNSTKFGGGFRIHRDFEISARSRSSKYYFRQKFVYNARTKLWIFFLWIVENSSETIVILQ